METYITVEQAAAMAGVDKTLLIQLVSKGKINAVNLWGGVVAVAESDLNRIPKEERKDYKALAGLAGVPIGISEAGRQYAIPQQTISRWVARGWIKKIGQQGRKTLIDAQDIAWYANIYTSMGGSHGRWVFDKSGIPYRKS